MSIELRPRRGRRAGGIEAVLWDVDGTLAETEHDGHRVAFNLAFEAFGCPWRWDERRYGELLAISGGRRRLMHDLASRPEAGPPGERERLAQAIHERKNALYADLVRRGAVPLRGGVAALVDQCRREGVKLAITTTTSGSNVDALLGAHFGPRWRERFAAVVCGEDVGSLKPDPEAYLRTLDALGLPPLRTVAIEDSPGGVAAACAAAVPVVVTRSHYFAEASIDGAIAIGPGLDRRDGWTPGLPSRAGASFVELDDLRAWHALGQSVSQYA